MLDPRGLDGIFAVKDEPGRRDVHHTSRLHAANFLLGSTGTISSEWIRLIGFNEYMRNGIM